MKTRLRTLLASAITLMVGAAAPLLADTATNEPVSFPSLKALQEWGEKGIWGGGRVDVFTSGTNRVAVARRAFTSGVESCELRVFIDRGKRWSEALRLGAYWGDWLEVSQADDLVTVAFPKPKNKELVRFSISGLCLQHDRKQN
jgi:hypothetical protein